MVSAIESGSADGKVRSLLCDGFTRKYVIHVPANLPAGKPAPLVIVLHGRGGHAVETATFGWNEKADREGCIAVYPRGLSLATGGSGTWRPGIICDGGPPYVSDDVAFLRAMIDGLNSQSPIDPRRVFVFGVSEGGLMAHRVGVELADKVAAVAVISGTIGCVAASATDASAIRRPADAVSIISFHGGLDKVVPYACRSVLDTDEGRAKLTRLSVPETISFWTDADGCTRPPSKEAIAEGAITKEAYSGGRGGAEVVLYTFENGGHTSAFGGRDRRGAPIPPPPVSVVDLSWEFFKNHPKK